MDTTAGWSATVGMRAWERARLGLARDNPTAADKLDQVVAT
jgi:hypothetical protein